MRKAPFILAVGCTSAIATVASAQIYHESARVLGTPNTNSVFLFDATGTYTGNSYDQIAGASGDAWGYRDGAFGDNRVWFGWGGGLASHACDGSDGLLECPNNTGNATVRALAYDSRDGTVWTADFGSSLVQFDPATCTAVQSFPVDGWSLYGLAFDASDGNLWGHTTGGTVIKIDTATGLTIAGAGWANGFANLAAQGGLTYVGETNLVSAVSQGTPDEAGNYDAATGLLVQGPWDIEGPSGTNGHLGVSVCVEAGQCGKEDTNGDGVVNVFDLLQVLDDWGPCVGCPGDVNNDDVVNVFDLLAVLDAWGPCGAQPAACCLPDNMCIMETLLGCLSAGGRYQGDGTDCMTVVCMTPVGACCFFPSGMCTVDTASGCIIAGGSYQGDGTDCMMVTCPTPPANDNCADAEAIGDVTNLPFDTTNASPDGPPMMCPPSTSTFNANDIWYCYTATCTGQATISLCGSSYDTALFVFDGCSCNPLGAQIACNDDFLPCGLQSEVTIAVTAGNSYLVQVQGFGTGAGAGVLTISCVGSEEGACCLPPDVCQDNVSNFDCTAVGGIFQGAGSDCATTVCPLIYCESTATATIDSICEEVDFAGVTTNSAAVCATYTDNTGVALVVTAGSTNTLTVTAGDCDGGGAFNRSVAVFIDLDNNGDFAGAGEEVLRDFSDTAGGASTTHTADITIAAAGSYRMRVVVTECADNTCAAACGTFTWGETEDYEITVQ